MTPGNPTQFTDDEYVVRRRPRSVLCLPLVKQAELTGLMYLENNLAPAGMATAGRSTCRAGTAGFRRPPTCFREHARYAELMAENRGAHEGRGARSPRRQRMSLYRELALERDDRCGAVVRRALPDFRHGPGRRHALLRQIHIESSIPRICSWWNRTSPGQHAKRTLSGTEYRLIIARRGDQATCRAWAVRTSGSKTTSWNSSEP